MEYIQSYIARALQLAIAAHTGQKDKGGNDYINHPVTVAMILAKNGYSDKHIAAALLHDVIEDTEYTFDDLEKMGFSQEIVDALRLLTHDETVPYFTYVNKIKTNPIAKVVKIADLLHNLDETRIPCPTDKDRARWEKYRAALIILEQP